MKVLIVDDNVDFAKTIAGIIQSFNVAADCVHSPSNAIKYLEHYSSEIMLILLDIEFGFGETMNGLDLLDIFRREYISIPVVMISGKGTIETAVRATKLGAVNFIEKNIISKDKIQDLIESVTSKHNVYGNESEIRKFLESNGIIGKSKEMLQVGESIIRYGRTDLNILITGPTGVGKTLVASAIHKISRRMRSAMITIDIPNIVKNKFHADFFGYMRGTFEEAKETTRGFFQQADKSSLFFDEIGALPLELQSGLLIPIEEKSIHKMGSIENEVVDIRFIAATSTDLLALIKSKQFNEQLYHRLRECEINVPPLEQRREDIPEIVNYLTNKHNAEYQENKYFSATAIDFLLEQNWRGNIRELYSIVKTCLQTKVALKSDAIEVQDITREVNNPKTSANAPSQKTQFVSLDKTLGEDVAEMNKIKIEKALIRTNGNVSKAAALLGVSRETLHNKIRKYEINHQRFRNRN